MKTINVIGAKKNGPEPLAAVRAAVERGETELEVLLDNPVSASGVMRFLENVGFGVRLMDDEGTITISARKGKHKENPPPPTQQPAVQPPKAQPIAKPAPPAQAHVPHATQLKRDSQGAMPLEQGFWVRGQSPAAVNHFSVLITHRALGDSSELGETLMKNFLAALGQAERPPLSVALLNEGVLLARYDSSSCDHLKTLEKKGVSILVCGVCANYFGIMDEIGAGSICGMEEILETVNEAGKVITL